MNRRVAAAALGMFMAAGVVLAQNARLDGMGGTTIVVDDVTDVIGFPAYVLDYPDQIQATYDGNVGPLIGIKELNSTMSAGMSYDQNRVLGGDAYTFLVDNLVAAVTTGAIALAETDVDPIPHFLFGMDLGGAKLGFDVFFERAFYTSSVKSITGGAETTTKIKGRFMNPGLLASLHLEMLRIAVGASVPIARQSYERETTAGTLEEKAKSKASVAADLAAELDLELFDLDWTFGVSADINVFSGEYELKPVTGASTTTTYESYMLATPALYGGTSTELGDESVLLAVTGLVAYEVDRMKPENVTAAAGSRITRDDFLIMMINMGLEKAWDNLNRLDAIYTRAGLTYGAVIGVDRRDGESGGDEYHARVRVPTARNGFGLPLGVGIQKSIFALDVQIDPGVLINTFKLVNGTYNPAPASDFLKATLTVDFGKGGGRSRSSSLLDTSTPAAEPAPSSVPTDLEF